MKELKNILNICRSIYTSLGAFSLYIEGTPLNLKFDPKNPQDEFKVTSKEYEYKSDVSLDQLRDILIDLDNSDLTYNKHAYLATCLLPLIPGYLDYLENSDYEPYSTLKVELIPELRMIMFYFDERNILEALDNKHSRDMLMLMDYQMKVRLLHLYNNRIHRPNSQTSFSQDLCRELGSDFSSLFFVPKYLGNIEITNADLAKYPELTDLDYVLPQNPEGYKDIPEIILKKSDREVLVSSLAKSKSSLTNRAVLIYAVDNFNSFLGNSSNPCFNYEMLSAIILLNQYPEILDLNGTLILPTARVEDINNYTMIFFPHNDLIISPTNEQGTYSVSCNSDELLKDLTVEEIKEYLSDVSELCIPKSKMNLVIRTVKIKNIMELIYCSILTAVFRSTYKINLDTKLCFDNMVNWRWI